VCFFILQAVDSNVDRLEGEDDFEDIEEDQGQATQGKPPFFGAYLDPSFTYAIFPFMFIQRCVVLKLLLPLDSDSLATRLH
jgi:hypothetical protein